MKTISKIISILLILSLMSISANAVSKPAKVKQFKVTKVTASSVSLKWKKSKRAKKYQVYISTGKKFRKAKTLKKNRITIKKLKPNTKYRFKVRGINGKKSGKLSNPLSVRTYCRVVFKYKILDSFYDFDIAQKVVGVKRGTNVKAPKIPTTLENAECIYKFTKWDKSVKNIQSNMVINALYKKIVDDPDDTPQESPQENDNEGVSGGSPSTGESQTVFTVNDFLNYINNERSKVNSGPLVINQILCDAATAKAEKVYNERNGHSSGGVLFADNYCEPYGIVLSSENISYLVDDSNPLRDCAIKWLNSDKGHRESLLNSKNQSIGVGSYKDVAVSLLSENIY